LSSWNILVDCTSIDLALAGTALAGSKKTHAKLSTMMEQQADSTTLFSCVPIPAMGNGFLVTS